MAAGIIQNKSKINYSYSTIRVTQSRIDKGLIALPVSLSKWFPDHNDTIQIYLNDSRVSQTKRYSSYNSRTRECRIGGLRSWFLQNNIKSGDEIVIQFVDKERLTYRLTPERTFILETAGLQESLDNSKTEHEAAGQIKVLAQWTYLDNDKVVHNEYYRLANALPSQERRYVKKAANLTREGAPANLRALLKHIYSGHCQVCDFSFLDRDRQPYFETHHLDPMKGHHPKNLVVVCGNCHNQFEHASVRHDFDDAMWLVGVSFNERFYSVKQVIVETKVEPFVKKLFT